MSVQRSIKHFVERGSNLDGRLIFLKGQCKQANACLTNEITTRSKPRQMVCVSQSKTLFLLPWRWNRCFLPIDLLPGKFLLESELNFSLFGPSPGERCTPKSGSKKNPLVNLRITRSTCLVFEPRLFVTRGASGNYTYLVRSTSFWLIRELRTRDRLSHFYVYFVPITCDGWEIYLRLEDIFPAEKLYT